MRRLAHRPLGRALCCAIFTLLLAGQALAGEANGPPVWILPGGEALSCGNESIPFGFSPRVTQFDRANAFWMMWMAMRSFHSEDTRTKEELARVGFDRYTALNNPWTGLQGFVAGGRQAVVVAFRGSVEWIDWLVDLNFLQRDGATFGVAGRIHGGFADTLLSVWPELERAVYDYSREGQIIWLTGHSMGGALATLAATRLARLGYALGPLYTFAAPRSGDEAFGRDALEKLRSRHYRIVNDRDLVPRLPPTAGAAAMFSALIPFGWAARLARDLVESLGYVQQGYVLWASSDGLTWLEPDADENCDVSYWTSLSNELGKKTPQELIQALSSMQNQLHNEKSYLCLMKRLYLDRKRGGTTSG